MKSFMIQDRQFFYKSNNRGEPGVDWFRDTLLEGKIRMCDKAIPIDENILMGCFRQTLPTITTNVFYLRQKDGTKQDRGGWSIPVGKLRWWLSRNGYYTKRDGGHMLPVPIVLWTQTRHQIPEDTKIINNQLKLQV